MRDLGYLRWQGVNLGGTLFDTFMLTTSYQRMEERAVKRKPLDGPTTDISDFDNGTTGLSLVLGKEIGRLGTLTYGVDWSHDEVDATKSRYDAETGAFIESLVPQFPQRQPLRARRDVPPMGNRTHPAALGGDRRAIHKHSSRRDGRELRHVRPRISPTSTRPQCRSRPSFQDWTGSVGLTYKLVEDVNLVGSISEGFRAPDLDELTAVSDNVFDDGVDLPSTGLRPETSINYEVGLKFNFPRLRGQMFHYWTDLDGLIQRELVLEKDGIQYYRRENIGAAVVQGLEMSGEYLLTTRWSLYGNFSTAYGQNMTDDEPLRRIPPKQGVVGLRWRDREARNWFEVYGWLVARQDRLSPGDISDSRIPDGGTPGYATLNVRAGRQLDRHQRISLGIENLTDKFYRVHGSGVDGPGISGNLGYEVVF